MKTLFRVVALLFVGIPLTFCAVSIGKVQWDDYFYARDLFRSSGIKVVRIIGSKRWHGFLPGPPGCTFAVAEISPASTAALVAVQSGIRTETSDAGENHDYFWQSDHGPWEQTPISREKFNLSCSEIPRECCLSELSKLDSSAIMNGLDAEGGWASRSKEVTSFFLPEQNIIGTIRHGD